MLQQQNERKLFMPPCLPTLLATYRKESGLSQIGLSRKAELTESYINRIESGERCHPSPAVMDSILRALNVWGLAADQLRISAGLVPNFASDPTVLQVVAILEAMPPATVREFRSLINTLERKYQEKPQ